VEHVCDISQLYRLTSFPSLVYLSWLLCKLSFWNRDARNMISPQSRPDLLEQEAAAIPLRLYALQVDNTSGLCRHICEQRVNFVLEYCDYLYSLAWRILVDHYERRECVL